MAEEPVTVLLSIVIPTLDAGAHLEACVTALEDGRKAALDQAMDVPDVEIIVADGGSSDETLSIAACGRHPGGRPRLAVVPAR